METSNSSQQIPQRNCFEEDDDTSSAEESSEECSEDEMTNWIAFSRTFTSLALTDSSEDDFQVKSSAQRVEQIRKHSKLLSKRHKLKSTKANRSELQEVLKLRSVDTTEESKPKSMTTFEELNADMDSQSSSSSKASHALLEPITDYEIPRKKIRTEKPKAKQFDDVKLDQREKTYACKIWHCKKRFDDKRKFRAHVQSHKQFPKNFVCKICPERFKTAKLMRCHYWVSHSGSKEKDDFDLEYKALMLCPVCQKNCKTLKNKKQHLKTHEAPIIVGDFECTTNANKVAAEVIF